VSDLAVLLPRLEKALGPCRGEPIRLEGGITNRNYRARFADRDYVVRLPGKDTTLLGIDRSAERLAAERAAALGIGPRLAYADADCSVTEFAALAAPEPERVRADPAPAAAALRAFHDSDLQLPARFWVPALLQDYGEIVRTRGVDPPAALGAAQELVEDIAVVLPLDRPVPSHNDLLPGNVLHRDGAGPLLVDWEYAGMGHRLFDLANLAAGHGLDARAEERLLESYHRAPAIKGRRAALQLMKIVSNAREAAWGMVQSVISDLDFDFDAYADEHFERVEQAAAHPELEDWLDAATA
jgi:aminoglycoside phosphotransferase (APT) family kinase protein